MTSVKDSAVLCPRLTDLCMSLEQKAVQSHSASMLRMMY